jgi:hypothetical protein
VFRLPLGVSVHDGRLTSTVTPAELQPDAPRLAAFPISIEAPFVTSRKPSRGRVDPRVVTTRAALPGGDRRRLGQLDPDDTITIEVTDLR